MRLELADPKERDRVEARILAMILRSHWSRPAAWKHAVVLIHPERRGVISRAQAAAELRAAGLQEAAHEVVARHVGPGQALLWVVVDRDEIAEAGFTTIDLRGGARR